MVSVARLSCCTLNLVHCRTVSLRKLFSFTPDIIQVFKDIIQEFKDIVVSSTVKDLLLGFLFGKSLFPGKTILGQNLRFKMSWA